MCGLLCTRAPPHFRKLVAPTMQPQRAPPVWWRNGWSLVHAHTQQKLALAHCCRELHGCGGLCGGGRSGAGGNQALPGAGELCFDWILLHLLLLAVQQQATKPSREQATTRIWIPAGFGWGLRVAGSGRSSALLLAAQPLSHSCCTPPRHWRRCAHPWHCTQLLCRAPQLPCPRFGIAAYTLLGF